LKGRSVAFFPDGKKIATVSWEDSITRIWDAESGKELQTVEGGLPEFFPDGKKYITALEDEIIKIWDTETGKKLYQVEGTWSQFSPNEKVFVTMTRDPITRIWDIESGKVLQEFRLGEQFYGFSSDGKRIFTAVKWSYFRIYDAESGRALRTILGMPSALSPDGKKMVMGDWEYEHFIFRIGDKATKKMLLIVGHTVGSTFDLLLEEAQIVVDNVIDNMIGLKSMLDTEGKIFVVRIWDIESGKALKRLEGPFAEGPSVFSPDGKRLFVPCEDGPLRVFDADSGKELQRLGDPATGMSYPRTFSPDGKKVVVARVSDEGDNIVRIWTLE
jgi:WD40 repeat protein